MALLRMERFSETTYGTLPVPANDLVPDGVTTAGHPDLLVVARHCGTTSEGKERQRTRATRSQPATRRTGSPTRRERIRAKRITPPRPHQLFTGHQRAALSRGETRRLWRRSRRRRGSRSWGP